MTTGHSDERAAQTMPGKDIEYVIKMLKRSQHNWFRLGVLGENDLMSALRCLEAALAGEEGDDAGEG